MKNIYYFYLIMTVSFDAPKQDAYDAGEWFKFRIHYGIVNAGYATLEVKDDNKIKKIFHVVGKGYDRCPVFSKWMTCMKLYR
jgi:uncharacterized protein YijF (DUF1287 family)